MRTGLNAGKVVIVTGGGSGIGAATSAMLAREGASVVVADRRQEAAEAVATGIVDTGGRAVAVRVDVASPQENERLASRTIEEFGEINGVFLNAGIVIASSISDGDLDIWRQVIDVNLNGVFYGIRATSPHLKSGDAILITASGAGLRGSIHMPSYVSSKHGVVGLMKAAAAEFAPRNIRVNAVCPGGTLTPITRTTDRAAIERIGRLHPLRRIGQPSEIADMACFLLSDRASFVTGQAVAVDGGATNILAEGEAFPDAEDSALKATLTRMNDPA